MDRFWHPRWKVATPENTEPLPPSSSIVEFGFIKYIEWPPNPDEIPLVNSPQESQYSGLAKVLEDHWQNREHKEDG